MDRIYRKKMGFFLKMGTFMLTQCQVVRLNLWNTDNLTDVSVQLWAGSKLPIDSGFRRLRDRTGAEKAFLNCSEHYSHSLYSNWRRPSDGRLSMD